MKTFTELKTIYLADNPISQADTYQEMLVTAIPSLTQIDGNMLRKGLPFHHQKTAGIHSIVKKEVNPEAKKILQEVIDQTEAQQQKETAGQKIGSSADEVKKDAEEEQKK